MKILFQTVGTGGKEHPVWEALAYSVREIQPDLLIQLCSDKTSDETVPKFDAALAAMGRPLPARRIEICPDPDDVVALTRAYFQIMQQEQKELPADQQELLELHADYTSGTKAMSAALVTAATSHRQVQLHYAVGARDASGRATRTDRLCSLSPRLLVAREELRELGELFNHGQFSSVREQIKPLIRDLKPFMQAEPGLWAQASTLRDMATVYGAWRRFDWDQARHDLRPLLQAGEHGTERLQRAGWPVANLREQADFLKRCSESPLSTVRLLDLLASAERCVEAGLFDDAVARMYRLTEYLLQIRFSTHRPMQDADVALINPTKEVPAAFLAQHAPQVLEKKEGGFSHKTVNLGLEDTLRVLISLKDPVAEEVHTIYGAPWTRSKKDMGPLYGALKDRNESWLAHGTRPCREENTQQMLELLWPLVKTAVGAAGEDAEQLRQQASFQRCPWI